MTSILDVLGVLDLGWSGPGRLALKEEDVVSRKGRGDFNFYPNTQHLKLLTPGLYDETEFLFSLFTNRVLKSSKNHGTYIHRTNTELY